MKKREQKSEPQLMLKCFGVDFELKTTWDVEDKLKFVTNLLNSDQRKDLSEREEYMEMKCALIDACKRIREREGSPDE
jgi:hypothetical protein